MAVTKTCQAHPGSLAPVDDRTAPAGTGGVSHYQVFGLKPQAVGRVNPLPG